MFLSSNVRDGYLHANVDCFGDLAFLGVGVTAFVFKHAACEFRDLAAAKHTGGQFREFGTAADCSALVAAPLLDA
jgi:hypothetical protein